MSEIRLFNQDCMKALAEMPDKAFDIAIVDPPYGINAPKMAMGTHLTRSVNGYPSISTAQRLKGRLNSGSGKLKNRILNTSCFNWDNEKPLKQFWDQLFRVSKNQIVWGGNYFDLPATRCIVVWDKLQPWENFSQVELAWTSFDRPLSIFRYSNTGGANKEEKFHPTQKPVFAYKYLLKKFAKEGDKILDTHLGSGSIAIACHDMGFDLDGYEIDKDYYDAAVKRLKLHQSQLSIPFGA